MKRSPIKRKTGLKRTPLKPSTYRLKRSPLRRRSPKMEALYSGSRGRRAFVAQTLSESPHCEVRWEGCTVSAVDVHEVFARGLGGAIVPGEKADRQTQRFVTICRDCHNQMKLQPDRAKAEGWVRGIADAPR